MGIHWRCCHYDGTVASTKGVTWRLRYWVLIASDKNEVVRKSEDLSWDQWWFDSDHSGLRFSYHLDALEIPLTFSLKCETHFTYWIVNLQRWGSVLYIRMTPTGEFVNIWDCELHLIFTTESWASLDGFIEESSPKHYSQNHYVRFSQDPLIVGVPKALLGYLHRALCGDRAKGD